MNHRLMRRHIHPTILLRARQTKHMIVLINRTAHRTKTIMTIRQHIRHWKLRKPRRPRRLNNSYKRNIMGRQLVKPNLQLLHISRSIMTLQNPIRDRLLPGLLLRRNPSHLPFQDRLCILRVRYNPRPIQHISSALVQLNHILSSILVPQLPSQAPSSGSIFCRIRVSKSSLALSGPLLIFIFFHCIRLYNHPSHFSMPFPIFFTIIITLQPTSFTKMPQNFPATNSTNSTHPP